METNTAVLAAPDASPSIELATRPAALVLLMALNFLDVFSTGRAMAAGGHEANPLAAWVLGNASGLAGLLLSKALLVGIVVGLVLLAKNHTERLARAVWRAVLLYGLVVVWNSGQVLLRGLH
jgi:Domain of unknown function (DUF5658)